MRYLTLLLVAGLALAVATPASAVSFAGLNWVTAPVDGQRIKFDIIDFTMAKTYVIDNGVTVNGVAAVDALVQLPNPVPAAQVINKGQVGLGGIGNSLVGMTEDGWGIVQVLGILDDASSASLWDAGLDTENEIWGLYYGGVDAFVQQVGGMQITGTVGVFTDLYIQPKGTFASFGAETQGAAGRFDFDSYIGIGFDAAGNPLVGAELMLELESTAGKEPSLAPSLTADVDGDLDVDTHQIAVFTPQPVPVGSGTGTSSLFYDLQGGTWYGGENGDPGVYEMTLEGPDPFYAPGVYPPNDPRFGLSPYADMHASQTITPYDEQFGWIISSDDPTRAAIDIVPEPLTVLGVLMGVGGLGRYMRRRVA